MKMKTTPIQNGSILWDHLGVNLSLKKIETAIADNPVKYMSAPKISPERALRIAKPIAHIPMEIPTICADNLSLKKPETAIADNAAKYRSASTIFPERALRIAKPIAHIPAKIPTI